MDIEDANGAADTTEESKKEKPTITSVGLKENIKNVAAAAKSNDETPCGEENTSTDGKTAEETKATPDDKEDKDGEVQVEDAQKQQEKQETPTAGASEEDVKDEDEDGDGEKKTNQANETG